MENSRCNSACGGHVRLNERLRLLWIESRCQPVQSDFQRILFHSRSVGIIRRKRVPVGDFKETLILILHAHPVVEGADVIAKMQFSGRAHAAEHALTGFSGSCHRFLRNRKEVLAASQLALNSKVAASCRVLSILPCRCENFGAEPCRKNDLRSHVL